MQQGATEIQKTLKLLAEIIKHSIDTCFCGKIIKVEKINGVWYADVVLLYKYENKERQQYIKGKDEGGVKVGCLISANYNNNAGVKIPYKIGDFVIVGTLKYDPAPFLKSRDTAITNGEIHSNGNLYIISKICFDNDYNNEDVILQNQDASVTIDNTGKIGIKNNLTNLKAIVMELTTMNNDILNLLKAFVVLTALGPATTDPSMQPQILLLQQQVQATQQKIENLLKQ